MSVASTAKAWIRLGRVSNLPTVWSNVLAALVVAGQPRVSAFLVGSCLMSLFYVCGMILNDAFDSDYDARLRPNRPIPSGHVSRAAALRVGFGGLGLGSLGVGLWAARFESGFVAPCGVATLLAGAIVLYDVHHKNNPVGPAVMGACRALVILCVASVVGSATSPAVIALALLQWCYVAGLTYAAKQEDLARPGASWPVLLVLSGPVVVAGALMGWWLSDWVAPAARTSTLVGEVLCAASAAYGLAPLLRRPKQVGVAVGRMIAGIAVVDALVIATTGWLPGLVLALAFALLTRAGQRFVPGT